MFLGYGNHLRGMFNVIETLQLNSGLKENACSYYNHLSDFVWVYIYCNSLATFSNDTNIKYRSSLGSNFQMDSLHEIQQGHVISNCWYLFWSTRCSKSYHRFHPSCLAKPIGSMELVYLPIFWHNFDPNVGTYHTWILWELLKPPTPTLTKAFFPPKPPFRRAWKK